MKRSTYANRGKQLETLVELSCKVYKNKKIAFIDKVPTPWNVSYNRKTKQARNVFPEKKGTVDFVGHGSDGVYIGFDAKETKGKSMPLSNVQAHQLNHLKNVQTYGGHAFLVIYFSDLEEYYRLPFIDYDVFKINSDRKSIPVDYVRKHGKQIKSGNGVHLDFLNGLYE